MKIGFRPKSKDDWRLLLRLAKVMRLSDRAFLAHLIDYAETCQRAEGWYAEKQREATAPTTPSPSGRGGRGE